VGVELGQFGVWIGLRALGDEGELGLASRVAEELGYGAIWVGGSPRLTDLRAALEGARRIVVASGIVNVWQYEPRELAAEFAELEADHPGRLLVGIGIGHPEATRSYARPLETMSRFIDGLDSASEPLPRERRCMAALGPRMLELSRERSLGAHPYFVPVEHTRYARGRLGPDALLAPELAVVVGEDPDRRRARAYAQLYLRLRNYTSNLERVGFAAEDVSGGGSDRLIDELVPRGTAAVVAAAARRHIEAGADHVCLQTVGVSGVPRSEWTALARELFAGG
jgi:probable F420-dependent oxidoreductase